MSKLVVRIVLVVSIIGSTLGCCAASAEDVVGNATHPPAKHRSTAFLDDVVRCPQVDNSTGHSNYNRLGYDQSHFRYPSTTVGYCTRALQSIIFAIIVFANYDGVFMYSVKEKGTSESDGLIMQKKRKRVPCTDFRAWSGYFLATFVQFLSATIILQVPWFAETPEAMRIGTLVVRLALGMSCVLLTQALIHQRVYRTQDYRASGINTARIRQGRIVLRVCVSLYLVYVAGEFIASHVISTDSMATQVLFWCYIAALILINIPAVLATVWVCFHQAQIQPSALAKVIALIGVLIHFISMPPPSFWNLHLWPGYLNRDPCPLKYLSLFDLVIITTFVGALFFFVFVILEHKRNILLMLDDEFQRYAENITADAAASPVHMPNRSLYPGRQISDMSLQTVSASSNHNFLR